MHEFRVCVVCDHQRGFQIALKPGDSGHRLLLICPNCGQSYNPGWDVTIRAREIEKSAVYE